MMAICREGEIGYNCTENNMADNKNHVFWTQTPGTPAEGMRDQYADGTAAKLWELYIGDKSQRTKVYKDFIISLLKKNKCVRILDVACGTGVDSIMLLEEGFKMTSVDMSDKMLKHALKTRWQRRKEPAFDAWVIEEANWVTLTEDLAHEDKFDAVVCLGNSFAHLHDQSEHRKALENFSRFVKPGGIFVIDHRNYDYIIETGVAPKKNIYYNSEHIRDIETSVLFLNGKPNLVTLDYNMEVDKVTDAIGAIAIGSASNEANGEQNGATTEQNCFRLSYFPHRMTEFSDLLKSAFEKGCKHSVFGDFKPVGEIETPGFYIHVVEKPLKS